jgi:hypothetical protein
MQRSIERSNLAPSEPSAQIQNLLQHWCEDMMMFYLELISLLGRCDVVVPLLDYAIELRCVHVLVDCVDQ